MRWVLARGALLGALVSFAVSLALVALPLASTADADVVAASDMLSLNNQLRFAIGSPTVPADPRLTAAAQAHANYSSANGQGGHFETAGGVGDRGQLAGRVRTCLRDDDLIRVGIDDKIRVVRHQDDLALGFCSTEEWDQLLVDGLRVQALFWLINDQRAIIRFIESKIQQ